MKEKKSGTSCYQVAAPSESLELGLGQGLRTAIGADAVATSAYLDVELKGSARVLATALLGGVVVGTYEVQSGSSIGKPTVADHTPFACTSSSDSGPDSGVNDNCRWPVSAPSWTGADDGVFFDTLTLKALVGSFSLEGGADGAVLPAAPRTHPERLDPRDRGRHPRLWRDQQGGRRERRRPAGHRLPPAQRQQWGAVPAGAVRHRQRPPARAVRQATRQPDERAVHLGRQGTGREGADRPAQH